MKIPNKWIKQWVGFSEKWTEYCKRTRLTFQYIQDDIYEIDKVAYPWMRAFTALLALLVIASILIPIGFELTPRLKRVVLQTEQGLLIGFIFYMALRLFLTSNRLAYLRKRWFEAFLSVLAIFLILDLNFSFINLVDYFLVGVAEPKTVLINLIKGYLLLFVFIKVLHNLPSLLDQQKNPARLAVYSFSSIIGIGCLMLMLPGATQNGEGLSFINALFTSTSAVCVTGLIVVDTATHFTLFGEIVIMALIQLGGIGILTFATFLFIYISGGLGVSQTNIVKNAVAEDNASLLTLTLKRVISFVFIAEGIAVLVYYLSWDFAFASNGQRWLFSIFHSISAFCNAGFSLFTNSLSDTHNAVNVPINITTMLLFVIGGLGFTSVWEIIQKKVTNRSWHNRLSVHTRTMLFTTGILIVAGTVLILILEWSNTLAGFSYGNKFLLALFQSVTTRTAGFNTLDTGAIGISATLVMIILMFIGGSPASTAGGVKTTTVSVIFRSLVATIRGHNRMELFKRTVPNTTVFQAMAVITLALSCISISTILLSITEDFAFIDLLFEEVSAFATVGLSRGITSELSNWGKSIIIISMFWGRVGILTFMVAFARKADNKNYKYPEETLMVS